MCLDNVSLETLHWVHPRSLPDDGWDGLWLGGFCIECLEVILGLVFGSVQSELLSALVNDHLNELRINSRSVQQV